MHQRSVSLPTISEYGTEIRSTSSRSSIAKKHKLWKRRKDFIAKPTIGEEIEAIELHKTVKTEPNETNRRRAILVSKKDDESWGFTLQSYGIFNKVENEVIHTTYVDYVEANGPAFLGGMRAGDIILSINGTSMEASAHKEMVDLIQKCGDSIRMVVLFENVCKRVESYRRSLQLRRVLEAKLMELRSLEQMENRILAGKPLDPRRLSIASSDSSFSLFDDRLSLRPELDRCPTPRHAASLASFNSYASLDRQSLQSHKFRVNPRIDTSYSSLPIRSNKTRPRSAAYSVPANDELSDNAFVRNYRPQSCSSLRQPRSISEANMNLTFGSNHRIDYGKDVRPKTPNFRLSNSKYTVPEEGSRSDDMENDKCTLSEERSHSNEFESSCCSSSSGDSGLKMTVDNPIVHSGSGLFSSIKSTSTGNLVSNENCNTNSLYKTKSTNNIVAIDSSNDRSQSKGNNHPEFDRTSTPVRNNTSTHSESSIGNAKTSLQNSDTKRSKSEGQPTNRQFDRKWSGRFSFWKRKPPNNVKYKGGEKPDHYRKDHSKTPVLLGFKLLQNDSFAYNGTLKRDQTQSKSNGTNGNHSGTTYNGHENQNSQNGELSHILRKNEYLRKSDPNVNYQLNSNSFVEMDNMTSRADNLSLSSPQRQSDPGYYQNLKPSSICENGVFESMTPGPESVFQRGCTPVSKQKRFTFDTGSSLQWNEELVNKNTQETYL